MFQEVSKHYEILKKDLNCSDEQILEFEEKSGLDASDIIYKLDCCYAFEKWLKTGEIDDSVYGFHYDWAADLKPHGRYTEKWLERHTHEPTEEERARLKKLYDDAWEEHRKGN